MEINTQAQQYTLRQTQLIAPTKKALIELAVRN